MTLRQWFLGAFRPDTPAWISHVVAGLITVPSVILVTILWREVGAVSDPAPLLLLTVAVTTYLAGGMPGMVSAGIVLFCSFLLFSHPVYLFRYSEMDWRQIIAIVITCPLIALLVGSLKQQVDRLHEVTAERDRLKEAAKRIEGLKSTSQMWEQRFQALADSTDDQVVFSLDTNGAVVDWTPASIRVLGYQPTDVIGRNYAQFFTLEEQLAGMPERLLEKAYLSGRVVDEGGCIRRDGARIYARFIVTALRMPGGTIGGYVVVARDLTDAARRAIRA